MMAQPVLVQEIAIDGAQVNATSVASPKVTALRLGSGIITQSRVYARAEATPKPKQYAVIRGKKNVSLMQTPAYEGRTREVGTHPSPGKTKLSFVKYR